MATVEFIKYDAAQSPPLRQRDATDTLPPAALPLATGTDPGAMTAAQVTKLAGIEAGATADQIASEVTFAPTGTITATNVQDAIAEVAAEAGSGSGNVTGPGSSTVNRVALFSTTGGDSIKESPVVAISDAGAVTGVASIAVSGAVDGRDVSVDGAALDAHVAAAAPHAGHATLAGGTVPLAEIPVLDSSKLGTDSVGAAQIAAGAVGTAELAGNIPLNKLVDASAASIVGATGAGDIAELTPTQGRAVLNVEDGAQANSGINLSTGGAAVFKQVNGSGELEFRRLNGGMEAPSPVSILTVQDDDNIYLSLANNSVSTAKLTSNSVGYPQLKDLSGPVFMGRVSAVSGDPESVTPAAALGMLGVEAGSIAPPFANADLADMSGPAFKLRRTGTGSPEDGTPDQARSLLEVSARAGRREWFAPRFKMPDPLPNLDITGKWAAGAVSNANLATSHGASNDLFPFMTFAAVNFYGYPHFDHAKLASASDSGNSDFNGYLEGYMVLKNLLRHGMMIRFEATGYIENTINADALVEFVLEPNPVIAVFTGANRMRMLSGELGATWTGQKACRWVCDFQLLNAPASDSYQIAWRLEIEDVLDFSDRSRFTGGVSFRDNDVNLSTRLRVDRIANIDTYDSTYQGLTTLKLEASRFRVMKVAV